MTSGLLSALGGVGLFLFGMTLLTEGLRSLAGSALRKSLTRFTKSPFSGAVTGAIATALIQSSSATTVTAVGFVSAGLMTFSQALGVIFGANIGTTITGWLVAIIGFKLHLGEVVAPLALIGALTRMFGRGRMRDLGLALAGFAVIFIGIDLLQAGMAAFEGIVTPKSFPGDTWFGRLELVFIGVAITLVTQSSSAGVAAALAALAAGAISFPQAAAMVIGMDVGTTFTAALATLGASTAARRTGYAHVVYNVLTGVMAFFLLIPYTNFIAGIEGAGWSVDHQFALVGFHTLFNTIGVIAILGFTAPFAQFIIRITPPSGPKLTQALDEKLLSEPHAAMDAVFGAVNAIAAEGFQRVAAFMDDADGKHRRALSVADIGDALQRTRDYLELVKTTAEDKAVTLRRIEAIHSIDHLRRLFHRLTQSERISAIITEPDLSALAKSLRAAAQAPRGAPLDLRIEKRFDALRQDFREARRRYREKIIAAIARGDMDPDQAVLQLDGVRWLHRVAYHLWRLTHHLRRAEQTEPKAETAAFAEESLRSEEDD